MTTVWGLMGMGCAVTPPKPASLYMSFAACALGRGPELRPPARLQPVGSLAAQWELNHPRGQGIVNECACQIPWPKSPEL